MAFANQPYISEDLIWSISRRNNCFLVKRKQSGGIQFSRDPLNLRNENSRKAVGVQPTEKSVVILSKKQSAANKPAQALIAQEYRKTATKRQIYKGVAGTAKNYRNDLIPAAVQRASAILASKVPKKDAPAKTIRGAKAAKFGLESAETA
ncbi:hypothetical protein KEM54_006864 [Ascosphaera aggregata]|nr:hypothetical protein KEM54_006864 [Ascosphaera aggregata]